jgi:hypothetical protein
MKQFGWYEPSDSAMESLASYWRQYAGHWRHYVECGLHPDLLAALLARDRSWGSAAAFLEKNPMKGGIHLTKGWLQNYSLICTKADLPYRWFGYSVESSAKITRRPKKTTMTIRFLDYAFDRQERRTGQGGQPSARRNGGKAFLNTSQRWRPAQSNASFLRRKSSRCVALATRPTSECLKILMALKKKLELV